MAALGTDIEDDLTLLDARIKQLKLEYEQYFMGARKREPQILRGEVQRIVAYYANVPIRNTGHRFKFNNLRARYFSFRRHWDATVRKIEDGRYEKHLFQAELHDRERRSGAPKAQPGGPKPTGQDVDSLFEAWVGARESTGQATAGLTREKLQAQLEKQRSTLRERHGVADVRFRVVVEDGRAKLKASPVKG
ncbi:MAG: MXAN_5187 C-terminal domain-containing protein [Myxococcota bacterium]